MKHPRPSGAKHVATTTEQLGHTLKDIMSPEAFKDARRERLARSRERYDAAWTDPDVARCREEKAKRSGRLTPLLKDAKQAFERTIELLEAGRSRNGKRRPALPGMTVKRPARVKLTERQRILASIDTQSLNMRAGASW